VSRETLDDDPQLGNQRNDLVRQAAQRLADVQMIMFDPTSGAFTSKDLGRIAAKYYVRHSSIEVFHREFKPKMGHADVLAMLSMSSEVTHPFFLSKRD
jgi:antiviral helicase SLH1